MIKKDIMSPGFLLFWTEMEQHQKGKNGIKALGIRDVSNLIIQTLALAVDNRQQSRITGKNVKFLWYAEENMCATCNWLLAAQRVNGSNTTFAE